MLYFFGGRDIKPPVNMDSIQNEMHLNFDQNLLMYKLPMNNL